MVKNRFFEATCKKINIASYGQTPPYALSTPMVNDGYLSSNPDTYAEKVALWDFPGGYGHKLYDFLKFPTPLNDSDRRDVIDSFRVRYDNK